MQVVHYVTHSGCKSRDQNEGTARLCNLNSELHPSLSAAATPPLGRTVMGEYADPSESESSQLNSGSGS